MKGNFFARVLVDGSNEDNAKIHVTRVHFEEDFESAYKGFISLVQAYGTSKTVESLEGYKLDFLYLTGVNYDGRKKQVSDEDILTHLVSIDLATQEEGRFAPTNELLIKIALQNAQRADLVKNGKYLFV